MKMVAHAVALWRHICTCAILYSEFNSAHRVYKSKQTWSAIRLILSGAGTPPNPRIEVSAAGPSIPFGLGVP